MNSIKPKLVVLAVYKKTDSKVWRGFCYPYDVTCAGTSEKETMEKLEELVKLYEEGLKQYNYPKHLSIRELSDSFDQEVFAEVRKTIAADLQKKVLEDLTSYQIQNFQIFKVPTRSTSGCYYSVPSFA